MKHGGTLLLIVLYVYTPMTVITHDTTIDDCKPDEVDGSGALDFQTYPVPPRDLDRQRQTDRKEPEHYEFDNYTLGDHEVQICKTASCRDSCGYESELCGCGPQCERLGRCCLDYEWFCKGDANILSETFIHYSDNLTKVILQREPDLRYECRRVNTVHGPQDLYMISTCPVNFKLEERQFCTEDRKTSILDVTPVTHEQLLYKNIHCARCNLRNLELSEVTPWRAIIECTDQDEVNRILTSKGGSAALLSYALTNTLCTIQFSEVVPFNLRCELSLVQKCALGTNHLLNRLCSSYAAEFTYSMNGVLAYYKNPHCAICNAVSVSTNMSCKPFPRRAKVNKPEGLFPSFSVLLDFSSPANIKIQATSCGAGFRKMDDRCHRVQCAEGYKVEGRRCVRVPDTVGHVRAVFIRALVTVINHSRGPSVRALNDLSYIPILFSTFTDSFKSCDRPYSDNGTITMCIMTELNLQTGLPLLEQLKIIAINGQLWIAKGVIRSTVIVLDFRPDSNQTCLINEELKTYGGNISETDLTTRNNKTPPLLIGGAFNLTLLIEDAGRQVEYTLKVCEEMMTCSWVMRNATDLEWRNGSVWMEHLNRSLKQHEFLNDSDQVRICSDLLILYEEKDENDIQVIVQGVLTLAGNIISMTSLVLTFVVYCLLPSLRNLAGLGTMNLCVALFLAQLSFQIGPSMQTIRVACQIKASLQHFFWLAAFSWMNSLLFNIAKTFGGSEIGLGGNSKGILWYAAFSWGVPLTFVVILYSLQASGVYDVGYGSAFCWMSKNSLIYFFAVPMACQILANIVLFVISAVGLYKSMEIAKGAKSEKEQMKADRARLLAYLKLSSIMGFTWIFGFLANINSASFLDYGFIVFSTLQGLFIMLSFVSSRRVLNMLGKRLGITCLDSDDKSTVKSSNTKRQSATKTSMVSEPVSNKV